VVAYGTFGSFLLGAQFSPRIRDLSTALYFAVVTLSTVGFGDIRPVTSVTRTFTISLIVLGLGVFATAAASVLGPALSNRLRRLLVPADTTMTVTNHVIIVGEGSMARNTARELAQRHIPLVQVVQPDGVPPLADQPVVRGDASDDATLEQAGIKSARMVIAATEDDGENAFIALAAKDLNADVRVIAVASSARAIRRLTLARADVVFAPAAVGGRLLADLVEGQQIPEEFLDLLQSGRA
jgi:voltage-gated potassium channel